MKRLILVVVVASAALVVVVPSSAEAGDTLCEGDMTGTFDNVIVPSGAVCHLTDATISGNVKALEDSRLRIENSTVGGNLEGDKADIVQLFFVTVREQISIKEGGPGTQDSSGTFNVCFPGATPCEALIVGGEVEEGGIQIEKMVGDVLVASVDVAGNLKLEENSITGLFRVGDSTVGQNLQVSKITGSTNKVIQENTVGQSLQCFDNDSPFAALFNTAGTAEGQCATP